jgi:hypothetical protein
MTATDFTIYHGGYAMPIWLTTPTVNPPLVKAALRQILRDYPDAECVYLTCWYEGTLPTAPEPIMPFRLLRR